MRKTPLLLLALSAPLLCGVSPARADLFGKVKDAIDRKGGEEKRDRDKAKSEAKGNAVVGAIKAAQGGDKLSQIEAGIYLSKAALAANRAKLKPNTKANGSFVGLGALKWGMTAAQVKAAKVAGKPAVAVGNARQKRAVVRVSRPQNLRQIAAPLHRASLASQRPAQLRRTAPAIRKQFGRDARCVSATPKATSRRWPV